MRVLKMVLGGVAAAIALPAAIAQAQPVAAFEGTWAVVPHTAVLKPLNGAVPFTAEGRKQYEENKRSRAKGDFEFDSANLVCSTPGLPRLMITPMRMQIWPRTDVVTFQFEWNRLFYQVDMTHREREPILYPLGVGDSKGTWEGDSLVIRTDNINDTTLIDNLVPHSDDLTLVQKLRLVDADTLENHITITDPRTFTRPWDAVVTYKRQPNEPFPEDICIDRVHAGQKGIPEK
jgi:hypothetical protein